MQASNEQLDEIKTQILTREGVYQLVPSAEYCRPKVGGTGAYAGPNSLGLGGVGGVTNSVPGVGGLVSHGALSGGSAGSTIIGGGGGGGQGGVQLMPIKISFTKVATTLMNPGAANNTVMGDFSGRLSHSLNDGLDSVEGSGKVRNSPAYNHHGSLSCESPHQRERIIFNIGREIFIFAFNGVESADLSKLVDRRVYKATLPTCHDVSMCPNLSLIVIGFSLGQVQVLDLNHADNKFYNQDRFIDKSRVTCVRWLPRSKSSFLVSYTSGQMYLYKEDLTCGTTAPIYQQYKQGEGFTIYTCKTKQPRNPIFRWSIGVNNGSGGGAFGGSGTGGSIGNGLANLEQLGAAISNSIGNGSVTTFGGGSMNAINEFGFSPCGHYLAIVSQDGFLRVFDYDQMELVGRMRSYFGGLLCLAWSHDGRLIVTGGEDDLITIWSMTEKRVVARGQGHKSWVNVVAFDPYMTNLGPLAASGPVTTNGNTMAISDSEEEEDDRNSSPDGNSGRHRRARMRRFLSHQTSISGGYYRIGSVGQDTQICLWDLTEDIIGQSINAQQVIKSRAATGGTISSTTSTTGGGAVSGSSVSNISEISEKTATSDKTNGDVSQIATSPPAKEEEKKKRFFFKVGSKTLEKPHKSSGNFGLSSRSFSDKHAAAAAASVATSVSHSKATGGVFTSHLATSTVASNSRDTARLLGTVLCPRLDEVPMLEPHVAKKIAHERLTAMVFRKEALVIGNQDGKVLVYARPSIEEAYLSHTTPNGSIASEVNESEVVVGGAGGQTWYKKNNLKITATAAVRR